MDIGIGDPLLEPTETLSGRDWLAFAGIPAPTFTCISKEQQFAEKLHAYTMPDRPRPNSRVKDLVDMVLMIRRFAMDLDRLADAIDATFNRRDSHSLPEVLTPPPENWTHLRHHGVQLPQSRPRQRHQAPDPDLGTAALRRGSGQAGS